MSHFGREMKNIGMAEGIMKNITNQEIKKKKVKEWDEIKGSR